MKLIKKLNKNRTWIDEEGKEHKSYNYFLQLENGKRICVRPVFKDDYKAFDFISEYEG